MARAQVADEGDGLHIWMGAASSQGESTGDGPPDCGLHVGLTVSLR
jgi:hypothetical protein